MRSELQASLVRGLGAVRSRRVGVALGLWGEPGIGKTFLTGAVLAALACASHRAHATQDLGALALTLPRGGRLPAWAERQLERLARGERLDPAATVNTLAALLGALAPCVLCLEDLHEAEAAQQALIVELARAVRRSPGVGLLVSSRRPLPEPIRSQQLTALDGAELRTLLTSALGADLPGEAAAWIAGRTRGNPLFALEFLRYLSRQGFLWSDGQRWHWRSPPEDFVPVTVEALIGQLSAGVTQGREGRAVLEARALLPADLPPERLEPLWAAVAGVTPGVLSEAVAHFGRAGLLQAGDFAHPLYREVALRNQRPERRRDLARAALAALEDDPVLAARFVADAELPPQAACAAFEQAAEVCRQAQRPAEAARFLAASVPHAHPAERPARALAAARALAELGLPEALPLAELAAQALPEAALLCAELLADQGRSAEAEAWLLRLPAALIGEQRWQLALRMESSRGCFGEVLRLWRAHPEWQADVPASLLKRVGAAHAFTGDVDAAEGIARALLARDDLTPDEAQQARNLMGQVLHLRSDRERLLAFGEESIALARAQDAPPHLALALLNQAMVLGRGADQAQVRALVAEAAQLFARLGHLLRHAMCQLRLAFLVLEEGHFEEAETLLAEAHALILGHDERQLRTESHLKQARLYLDWQPPHGPPLALRHARLALDLSRATGDQKFLHAALCYSAQAEARGGSPERALALANEALGLAEAQDHAERRANAQFALGLALEARGQAEEARALILRACAGHLALGERWTAEERGLEADRIAGDAASARARRDWLRAGGHLGAAHLAARYFPKLDGPELGGPELGGSGPPDATPAPPAVRLNVLGPLTLEREGRPVAYRGRKRAELLACLLEARLAGRPELSTLDLLDSLYPGEPEEAARRTLKQQVYLLRAALGAGCVLSAGGGYALGRVGSDAEDFLAGGPSELWRGPYLAGLAEGWRPGVRDALSLALRERVEGLLAADPPEAARLARVLCDMEPYDLAALRLAVTALEAAGERRAAQRFYLERRAALAEVGEVLPQEPDAFVGA